MKEPGEPYISGLKCFMRKGMSLDEALEQAKKQSLEVNGEECFDLLEEAADYLRTQSSKAQGKAPTDRES